VPCVNAYKNGIERKLAITMNDKVPCTKQTSCLLEDYFQTTSIYVRA